MSTKYDRSHPFFARLKERYLLTKEGALKNTYHVVLAIEGSGISYDPGDSVAVLPSNDPKEVEALLGLVHDADDALYTTLIEKSNLQKVRGVPGHSLRSFLESSYPRKNKEELNSYLLPLLPRFYSIASSSLLYPDELHLAVAEVSQGVATQFLCRRSSLGAIIPLYLQPSHKFRLPEDPHTPIIFIGPGTGVAPFRAFFQQRTVQKAAGRNWLFFGGRNRSADFLYEEEWLNAPRLRLTCAFSRDTSEKVYVQHKLWEERKDICSWIEEGAVVYVCGAIAMSKGVEECLAQIIDLKALRTQRRYLIDVY